MLRVEGEVLRVGVGRVGVGGGKETEEHLKIINSNISAAKNHSN